MQQRNFGGGFFSNIPPIVKNLILINILMLFATFLFEEFMFKYFTLHYPISPMFKPVQLFTYMFMHGGVWHLFFNMYMLYIFGSVLEQYWGSKRFLSFYIITGLGAAAFYLLILWLQIINIESHIEPAIINEMRALLRNGKISTLPDANIAKWTNIMSIRMLGASGAVFGVLLAFGMMFPRTRLQLIIPPVALEARWFVIICGIIELFFGIVQVQGDNIAHFAHLGGMIFGFVMIKYWQKRDR
jgi:membrane associated rhomboid family serine protease